VTVGYLEILVLVAVVVTAYMVIRKQSRIGGKWGVGTVLGTTCPRCGTPQPAIRKPASGQEMMWGGWTCANCGCHIDKYGKERAAAPGAPPAGQP
jgi:hypothetical protein